MTQDLTPRRKAFVAAYIANGRRPAAAYRAAYPDNASPRCQARDAHKLLQDPRVRALIADADRREKAALAEVAQRAAVSKARIVEALAQIAFARPGDYMSIGSDGFLVYDLDKLNAAQAAGLIEVKIIEYASGNSASVPRRRVSVRFADRRAALMNLAELMGYLRDPHRPGAIASVADLTDDELETLRAERADAETPEPPPSER